jgi:hypothetical protein
MEDLSVQDPSDAQLRWAFLVGEECDVDSVCAIFELDENVDCLHPAKVAASRV